MNKSNLDRVLALIPRTKEEFKLFFCVSLNMVLTLYIYSILRNMKDTLVMTHSSAELISTLKLFGVTPSAIIFMIIYTKMADGITRLNIYYVLIAFFAGFFVLFGVALYPNLSSLKFDLTSLKESAPYLKYPFIMAENWSVSLYYIMSELWGSAMLSLMFWQLANQIVSIENAKRFYPLFGLFGQIGLFFAGYLPTYLKSQKFSWDESFMVVTISVAVCASLMMVVLWYISNFVSTKDAINGVKAGKKKSKPGLAESLKYVLTSRYIGLIASLVICYGISINLVEGVWKKSLNLYYSDPQDISAYMGAVQRYTAIVTAFAMIAGSYILQMFSWRFAAILTPIMILVTGFGFFAFISFRGQFETLLALTAAKILYSAVFFGALQNVLSKSTKYSLFDATKEMSYIPLDEDLKAKGKAAADVVGGRFGKSGGAVIQALLLMLITDSSLVTLAPYLFGVFMLVMVWWLFAVGKLSVEFENLKKMRENESK